MKKTMWIIAAALCVLPTYAGAQQVLDRLVALAQADGQLGGIADTAPGRVHGIGRAILIVRCNDENGLGIAERLRAKIFTHRKHLS